MSNDNGFDPNRPRETDGKFAEYKSQVASGTLTIPPEPDEFENKIAGLLADGSFELKPASFDGQDVRVFRSPDGDWAQAVGDPIRCNAFDVDPSDSDDRVRELAAEQYRIDYLDHLEAKLGGHMSPEYDAALRTAIDRIESRDARGLVCPQGWSNRVPLRAVTDYEGDRLNGEDSYSRADWAEVSEDYASYGLDLPLSVVGEIVAGEQDYANESDDEYRERIDDALSADDLGAIDAYLTNTYGCQIEANGDHGTSLTFPVNFEDTGLSRSELSVEYLGDYVEKNTKLLKARNELEYGTALQRGIADALGYSWDYRTRSWNKG